MINPQKLLSWYNQHVLFIFLQRRLGVSSLKIMVVESNMALVLSAGHDFGLPVPNGK